MAMPLVWDTHVTGEDKICHHALDWTIICMAVDGPPHPKLYREQVLIGTFRSLQAAKDSAQSREDASKKGVT